MAVDLLEELDFPGAREAFWAAYEALGGAGVALAEIRGEFAYRIVDALGKRRATGGMRSMLRIAQATADGRRPMVLAVIAGKPSSYTTVTQLAIDAAIVAAAGKLAED